MKIFPGTHENVELSYQPNGSKWLCVLEGAANEIEEVFSSLFNWGACNYKQLDWVDDKRATFWSSEEEMRQYFYAAHYAKFQAAKYALYHQSRMMKELENSKVSLGDFKANVEAETYQENKPRVEVMAGAF